MRAACFVGRVGGLAVALGVGIAVVAAPAVAWADDSPSPPSGGSASPGSPAGNPKTIGTTAEPGGKPITAVPEKKGASAPESGSVGKSVRHPRPLTKPSSDSPALGDGLAKVDTRDWASPKRDANARRVAANTITAKAGATPPQPKPAPVVLKVAAHEPVAPRAVTALTAGNPPLQQPTPVAREVISTAAEEHTPPPPEVTETVLNCWRRWLR